MKSVLAVLATLIALPVAAQTGPAPSGPDARTELQAGSPAKPASQPQVAQVAPKSADAKAPAKKDATKAKKKPKSSTQTKPAKSPKPAG